MLPGLTPSLQAMMNYHEPGCNNEEEYARKHGHVVHLPTSGRLMRLVLTGAPVLIIFAVLLLRFFA